jgi:hypothetical protein
MKSWAWTLAVAALVALAVLCFATGLADALFGDHVAGLIRMLGVIPLTQGAQWCWRRAIARPKDSETI